LLGDVCPIDQIPRAIPPERAELLKAVNIPAVAIPSKLAGIKIETQLGLKESLKRYSMDSLLVVHTVS